MNSIFTTFILRGSKNELNDFYCKANDLFIDGRDLLGALSIAILPGIEETPSGTFFGLENDGSEVSFETEGNTIPIYFVDILKAAYPGIEVFYLSDHDYGFYCNDLNSKAFSGTKYKVDYVSPDDNDIVFFNTMQEVLAEMSVVFDIAIPSEKALKTLSERLDDEGGDCYLHLYTNSYGEE